MYPDRALQDRALPWTLPFCRDVLLTSGFLRYERLSRRSSVVEHSCKVARFEAPLAGVRQEGLRFDS